MLIDPEGAPANKTRKKCCQRRFRRLEEKGDKDKDMFIKEELAAGSNDRGM